MEEKRDLRIQKTYNALFSAFISLLETKKFEEITVNELCDRAMVGRGTFYKHFADKYEFLSFMIKDLYRTHIRQVDNMDKHYDPISYYTCLIRIGIDFMEANTALMSCVESSSIFNLLQEIIAQDVTPDIVRRLEKDQQAGYVFKVDSELMAQLMVGALIQCGRWWFLQRRRISKEHLLEQFSYLIDMLYTSARREGADAGSPLNTALK